jgi:hypothetical protein
MVGQENRRLLDCLQESFQTGIGVVGGPGDGVAAMRPGWRFTATGKSIRLSHLPVRRFVRVPVTRTGLRAIGHSRSSPDLAGAR